MSIFAMLCVKDEADRYLEACLTHLQAHVDAIFCYDDISEDNTMEVARKFGTVEQRHKAVPSFLEAEGSFREHGWYAMVEALNVQRDDWVVVVDADEFLVPAERLRSLVAEASAEGIESINVNVVEMFTREPPSYRTDGFWDTINGTRIARYQPGEQPFKHTRMACGVFPSYAYRSKNWSEDRECGMRILHYGYADEVDRVAKHDRYVSVSKNGHADRHIQSILQPPKLKPWVGAKPRVWRGTR